MIRAQALLEVAIVMPVMLVATVGLVQFSFWMHAEAVIGTAVTEGARVAAARGASIGDGRAVATTVVRDGLGPSASRISISVTESAGTVELRADGSMPSYVLSSIELPLHAHSSISKERFIP